MTVDDMSEMRIIVTYKHECVIFTARCYVDHGYVTLCRLSDRQ